MFWLRGVPVGDTRKQAIANRGRCLRYYLKSVLVVDGGGDRPMAFDTDSFGLHLWLVFESVATLEIKKAIRN